MDVIEDMVMKKVKSAKEASYKMMRLSTEDKNRALEYIALEIEKERENIKEENKKDLVNGKKKGLSNAFMDRLTLNDRRIKEMAGVLRDVAKLGDPVGEITRKWVVKSGLKISKKRMPLGVVGFIFESRPNVCAEVAALIIKSGNAVVLKGGSDAVNSNVFLTNIIKCGMEKAGLPEGCVEAIESTDRSAVKHLLRAKEYVDVIIPRGGKGLIDFVDENSLIPVIRHDRGLCHTYIDSEADIDMAVSIAFNAKVQRPGVCNAMETLLVHKDAAEKFLPVAAKRYKEAGVELRGCEKTKKILPEIKKASEEDWNTEYLDLILSIKVVESMEEAVGHINKYGSHHSDAVVTNNKEKAERFLTEVDSAACYVNASTRFTDGGEFGLGAEMGISNQKLHVRGPMALEGLTSEKFVIHGAGQIRE